MATLGIRSLLVIPLAVLFTGTLLIVARISTPPSLATAPDFAAFTDVSEKKAAFFAYMLPLVRQSNDEILAERTRLIDIAGRQRLRSRDVTWLETMADRYRISTQDANSREIIAALTRRIDTIPASLALAQAANESAWGTARFAVSGRNYFGLWCWNDSCGIIPARRDAGKKHEVARFSTPLDSVRYYMLTLNSHPAYQEFRSRRYQLRQSNQPLTGLALAGGLTRYSERRQAYVEEIRSMIRFNLLRRYNRELVQASQ